MEEKQHELFPPCFFLASSLTILMSHAFFGHKLSSGHNALSPLLSSMKILGAVKIALGRGRPWLDKLFENCFKNQVKLAFTFVGFTFQMLLSYFILFMSYKEAKL